MNTFTIYLGIFVAAFATWLALTAYVVLNRRRYDRNIRSLDRVLKNLGNSQPVILKAKDRLRIVGPMMAALPPPLIYRVATDASTRRPVSEVFAEQAVAGSGLAHVFAVANAGPAGHDPWQRISALSILSQTGVECIHDLLLQALQDKDQDVVSCAVILLGRLRDEKAAKLLALAMERRWHLPSFIARQLDAFTIPLSGVLLPLLDSGDPQLRYWGVMLLGRDRRSGLHDARIARLAEDPDPSVRKAVAQTLGMLGASREALAVLPLLYDDVPYVRAHAVKTLARFDRPDFTGSIMAMLEDPEWRVRLAAREALLSMAHRPQEEGGGAFDAVGRRAGAALGAVPGRMHHGADRGQPW